MIAPLRLLAPAAAGLLLCALAAPADAQAFVLGQNRIPSGSPGNNSNTENVDFGDVDLDGDFDVICADGGDAGNDQNRLWINMGGLQGGSIGFFQDQTTTRFPAVLDTSRDADFVDLDQDGDLDLYISNTSQVSNQSNRFWINQGLAQGGTAGFFADETSTRWVGIAAAGSSIPNSLKLLSGGFVDWSCDCAFADLDNDGDIDLVHTTYGGSFAGGVPSRIFLNDGAGNFTEFNPSGFQLGGTNILNGNPGLWCEGTFTNGTTSSNGQFCDIADTPLGVEMGDIDGDFDVDFIQGARNEVPRVFKNRLQENAGVLGFRDVTYAALTQTATGGGNYEQELGDLDNDGDLDLYGLNWSGLNDIIAPNDGSGFFGAFITLPGSGADDNEGDWFDYNNDGRLDLFVTNFSGQDKLYRNDGPPQWSLANVTASQVPSYTNTGLGGDACDIDGDGDYDFLVGNDSGQANVLLVNQTQIADAIAPRITALEQAPDRAASATPTAVRAHVYDNASWEQVQKYPVQVEYNVNGGAFQSAPMEFAGGQVFRGEIPGNLVGTVGYRVRATDGPGNAGVSTTRTYNATGGCTGSISTYCTAKTSSSGCVPAISSSGVPAPGAGFTLMGSQIEAGQLGVAFYGTSGALAQPFQGGFLCVAPPVVRLPFTSSGGAGACTGSYSNNLDTLIAGVPTGTAFWFQYWFRDPGTASGTGLSNALTFTTCP